MIGYGLVPAAQKQLAAVIHDMPPCNLRWVADHINEFDGVRQEHLATRYREAVKEAAEKARIGKHAGSVVQAANRALADYHQRLVRHDLVLSGSDADLKGWASARAAECQDINSGSPPGRAMQLMLAVGERYGIEFKMHNPDKPDPWPVIASATCKAWWVRQARRLQALELERYARLRLAVSRDRDLYVSDTNLKRRRWQEQRNQQTLENMEAINDDGEVFNLAALASRSIADPYIRHKEMMTRAGGFERVAKRLGHVAEFWTFTTPSRFHAVVSPDDGRCFENPAWKEAGRPDALEGQRWLCDTWSRLRAALHRAGIRYYGLRTVEPHHDGTPHWHMVIYFHPDDVENARLLAWAYFMEDNGHEPGALDHRCQFEAVDPEKGSATAYIAAYVAKNIDGAHMDGQVSDECEFTPASEAARRAVAWSRTWAVRQFQQLGGPSVTVWRELRKLKGEVVQPDLFEGAQQPDMFAGDHVDRLAAAADAGSWADFVMLMGGPMLPRDARPLRPAYLIESKTNPNPVEVTLPCVAETYQHHETVPGRDRTAYGAENRGSVMGLWVYAAWGAVKPLLTRLHEWIVRQVPKGSPAENPAPDGCAWVGA